MRKLIIITGALVALAIPSAAMAAGGPTTQNPYPADPQPGNSAFGNWRAGTADGPGMALRMQNPDGRTMADYNALDFAASGFDGGLGLSN
jgi:hypothetical protein